MQILLANSHHPILHKSTLIAQSPTHISRHSTSRVIGLSEINLKTSRPSQNILIPQLPIIEARQHNIRKTIDRSEALRWCRDRDVEAESWYWFCPILAVSICRIFYGLDIRANLRCINWPRERQESRVYLLTAMSRHDFVAESQELDLATDDAVVAEGGGHLGKFLYEY